MKTLLITIFAAVSLSSCTRVTVEKQVLEDYYYKVAEKAYFEGQRDAINGDIRIKLGCDSIYFWHKSCWDNGRKPIYNPDYLDSQNPQLKH